MAVISPTAEGFRVAFRRPLLTLGEITWRWVVGATATVLFVFGLFEYLSTLPVNRGELLFLRSRQPFLVAQAIAHILHGSVSRAVLSLMMAALGMVLLWMIAAALGRIATVESLLGYFRGQYASVKGFATADDSLIRSRGLGKASFPALVRLNFLRISVALAAGLAFVGASIVAGFVSPNAHPRPGLAFLVFLPLSGVIACLWCALNWFLSLAGMLAVRDDEDVIGAMSAAMKLCRERTGAVAAVSVWTGLAHLVVFVGATTIIGMPLGFVPLVPSRLVVLAMVFLTLVYFAVVDWLYMARLAGYVCILETPEALLRPSIAPAPVPIVPSPMVQGGPLQTTIDRDELILSDIPNPTRE